jgi:hypothetical protein
MKDDLKDSTRQIQIMEMTRDKDDNQKKEYILQCFFMGPTDPASKLYLHFGTYDSLEECVLIYTKIEKLGLGELFDLYLQQPT